MALAALLVTPSTADGAPICEENPIYNWLQSLFAPNGPRFDSSQEVFTFSLRCNDTTA